MMAVDDHIPCWRRRLTWSSDRLNIRKMVGDCLSFLASSLGMGADTSTSMDLCYVTVGTFARRGLGSVKQRH